MQRLSWVKATAGRVSAVTPPVGQITLKWNGVNPINWQVLDASTKAILRHSYGSRAETALDVGPAVTRSCWMTNLRSSRSRLEWRPERRLRSLCRRTVHRRLVYPREERAQKAIELVRHDSGTV
jgi:hypothetical protein